MPAFYINLDAQVLHTEAIDFYMNFDIDFQDKQMVFKSLLAQS